MDPAIVGVLTLVLWIILLTLRLPVGIALMVAATAGYWYLEGAGPTLATLGTIPYRFSTSYMFTVLPAFALMGQLAAYTGFSTELYDVARAWIGHLRGGLAMATILGCTMFSAVVGSPIATIVTMVRVSIPEMQRAGYDDKLSTGCLAAGSLIGPMIPPSTTFIVYSFLTEANLGDLFIAGIFPGLLICALYIITIYIWARLNPRIAPSTVAAVSWRERFTKAPQVWGVGTMFVVVLGGIYVGIFTPTEAGAIGAFTMIVLALARRKLNLSNYSRALMDTGQLVAMMFVLLSGVYVFNCLLAISQIPVMLVELCKAFPGGNWGFMIAIMILYIVTGCFVDTLAVIFITVPILINPVMAMGFDIVWFGVLICLLGGIGCITPPYGVSVFALAGMLPEIGAGKIFRGCVPFLIPLVVAVVLLSVFPQIATWLPYSMRPY